LAISKDQFQGILTLKSEDDSGKTKSLENLIIFENEITDDDKSKA
jgi:hypothetical protein